MTEKMYQLGDFRFEANAAVPAQVRRISEYRWPQQDRIGREPARQYIGPGEETMELEGIIYPGQRGNLGDIEAMRVEGAKGTPLMLSDGNGAVYGKWVILRVEETRTVLFPNSAPRRIEFRMSLGKYGDDR